MSKVKYAVLNCLCFILTGSTFPSIVYTSVKKFPRSLTHALEISRYFRVNNKHCERMELAIVGYLTIYRSGLKAPAEPSRAELPTRRVIFLFSKTSSEEIYHKYFLYKITNKTKNNKWNIKKNYNFVYFRFNFQFFPRRGSESPCRLNRDFS